MTTDPPPLVTVHLWRVAGRGVGAALLRMATQRGAVRRMPGVRFAKLLGTGRGRTFGIGDADIRTWGLLTAWQDRDAATAFEHSPVARSWRRIARESLRIDLLPLQSRGRWAGEAPFGDGAAAAARSWSGPVAVVTRARLRPSRSRRFSAAVPPVARALRDADGLRLAIGIGEAPAGLLGTFSVWDSAEAVRAFAYGTAEHADVVRRTPVEDWYAEELFARFGVVGTTGALTGVTL